MILSIAWAVLVVAGLVSVAAIPPARSLRTTSGASASIRVGPWRLRRRDVALGSLAIAASALVIGPVLTAGLAAVAMLARWWSSRRRIAADLAAREEVVPELVELVAVALRAGASPASAVDRVAVLTAGLPAEPIHRAAAQIRSGLPATEAWSALRELPGPSGRSMADLLASAERTGAPIADAMAGLADSARAERRRRFETRVQRLPILLLGPLVLCVLPSFLLLVCVPIVVTGLADLL